MSEIVKTCKKHGELTIKQTYQQYSKHKNKKYPYYQCKYCVSDKKKRLYYLDPIKHRKYALEQRKKHYEKCIKRDRIYKLKLLSESEYNNLLIKQNYVCATCKNPETAKSHKSKTGKISEKKEFKRLSIDHNHTTGMIRGLLCQRCNTAIGLLNESIDLFNSCIEYLKTTNQ